MESFLLLWPKPKRSNLREGGPILAHGFRWHSLMWWEGMADGKVWFVTIGACNVAYSHLGWSGHGCKWLLSIVFRVLLNVTLISSHDTWPPSPNSQFTQIVPTAGPEVFKQVSLCGCLTWQPLVFTLLVAKQRFAHLSSWLGTGWRGWNLFFLVDRRLS